MNACTHVEARGGALRGSGGAAASGVATDGARYTSQIDVPALHERDREITEGLHGEGACQRDMGLSTVVSNCGLRTADRGLRPSPPPPAPSSPPHGLPPARASRRTGAPFPRFVGARGEAHSSPGGAPGCEAHHETSVRPAGGATIGQVHRAPRPHVRPHRPLPVGNRAPGPQVSPALASRDPPCPRGGHTASPTEVPRIARSGRWTGPFPMGRRRFAHRSPIRTSGRSRLHSVPCPVVMDDSTTTCSPERKAPRTLVASSVSGLRVKRSPSSPISDCMPCSTADRNPRASQ